jgi:hypothetical protein
MTPDPGAQPGEPSPADGPGPRELLAYRSAQGRWVVAAMILGTSVAGIDATVVAVALPAIRRNLHAGAHPNPGAPPRLPGRLPRTAANRKPNGSQASNRSRVAGTPSPSHPRTDHA